MMFSPKEQFTIYPMFTKNMVMTNIVFALFLSTLVTILLKKGVNQGKMFSTNWGI